MQQVVTAYKSRQGDWPATLDVLTEAGSDGRLALLTKSSLKDPWGRTYQYDTNRLHPESGMPLIWTEGPTPGQSGSKMTNWDGDDLKSQRGDWIKWVVLLTLVSCAIGALAWGIYRKRSLGVSCHESK